MNTSDLVERVCTICGVDISALQFNRRRCHNPDCIRRQKQKDNAKRTKSTASPFTGRNTPRNVYSERGYVEPYQMASFRPIRSSGGTNLTPDVREHLRSEDWERLTRRRVSES